MVLLQYILQSLVNPEVFTSAPKRKKVAPCVKRTVSTVSTGSTYSHAGRDKKEKDKKEKDKDANKKEPYTTRAKRQESSSFDLYQHYNNVAFVGKAKPGEDQTEWRRDAKLYEPPPNQTLVYQQANCIAIETYLKLCGAPFTIEYRKNAEYISPSGKIPFLKCNPYLVSEIEPIVSFAKSRGMEYNDDFNDKEHSIVKSYLALIDGILTNAEMNLCWCDEEVRSHHTKQRYGKTYPFPLNHILSRRKKNEEMKHLKSKGWANKSTDDVLNEISKCFNGLSEKLGNNDYFFGKKPCEFDAVVYGHITALLSLDAPKLSTKIEDTLRKHNNLLKLAAKMDKIRCPTKYETKGKMEDRSNAPSTSSSVTTLGGDPGDSVKKALKHNTGKGTKKH